MYTVIDIETNGLEINADINLVGIHTFKDVKDEGNYEIYELPKEKESCVERLRKIDGFIGHNAKFDSKLIKYSLGVDLKIKHDTMYLCYACSGVHDMIYKRGKWFSLKDAAKRELNVDDWDVDLKTKTAISKESKEYLKKDLLYTRRLFEKYKEEIDKDDEPSYQLMIKAANVYRDIESNGMPIDLKKLKEIRSLYNVKKHEVDWKLKDHADINYNSSKQLIDLLYNKLKLPITKKTPKGKPSTGVDALVELQGKHDIIDLILEKRNIEKALTFLNDWEDRAFNDRIYGNFNLHTTVTGRTSSNGPNIQQVPRNKELKSLFNSKEGWNFVQIDYSQVELRVAAAVAGVTNMIDSYIHGEDLHTKMAKIVTGKDEIDKKDRTGAKAANFGYLYGMIAKSFVEYAKATYGVEMTLLEATRIRDSFFSTNKELLGYYKRVGKELTSNGYITNIFGRRYKVGFNHMYIPKDRMDYTRKGINFTVQSAASDYVIMGLIEVHHKYQKSDNVKIIGTVHDSILFEIKDDDRFKETLVDIKRIMEKPYLLNKYLTIGGKLKEFPLPIVVDIEVGPWGDSKEVNV